MDLNITIIHGSRKMTEMMQKMDVFEKFKVIASPVTYKIPEPKNISLKTLFEALKKGLEENEGQNVVAIFIQGDKENALIDRNIKIISDGRKMGFMQDVLKFYGLE